MKFVPKVPRRTAEISTGVKDWPTFLKSALSIGLSLLFVYLALGWTADIVSLYKPDRYEVRLFSWLKREPGKDEQELAQARRVFVEMVGQPGLRKLPYRLSMTKSKDPNAFAFPGGGVALTSGLLQEIRTDAGLALVIGHELGHHQHRDAMRGVGRGLLLQIAMSIFFGDGANTPAAQAILKTAESRHSRKQERRADEFGLKLAHSTFGHQEGELKFFEILLKEKKLKNSRWASFMASHPYVGSRIEHLKEIEKKP
ncbi:MAG: M48 family metallopeptidase [Elusimicrobiota bacterium]